MSNKEIAIQVINNMSEEKISSFLNLFLDENTLARIEADDVLNDDNAPVFNSAEELLEDLNNE